MPLAELLDVGNRPARHNLSSEELKSHTRQGPSFRAIISLIELFHKRDRFWEGSEELSPTYRIKE